MTNTPESTDRLEVNEQQIAWILESSGMSQWLKNTVRSALDNDPVRTLNDVESTQHRVGRAGAGIAY